MNDFDVERLRIEISLDASGARREASELNVVMDKATRDRVGEIKVTTTGEKQAEATISKVARDRTAKIDVDTKQAGDKILTLDKQTAKLFKLNQGADALGNIFGIVKVPIIFNALSVAAQGLTALAGGTYALGAALAPLVGYLAALPAGIVALGQVAGVALLSFKEAGAAIQAQNKYLQDFSSESAAAYMTAMKGLNEETQQFVRSLSTLKPEIEAMQDVASEGLFAGINASMPDLKAKLLPVLTAGLAGMSTALGEAIGGTLKEVGSTSFTTNLGKIMSTNTVAVSQLGTAMTKLVSGFGSLGAAAGPFVMQLTTMANRSATLFQQWAKSGDETGNLAKFLDRTVEVTQTLGDSFSALYGAMKNVGEAATGLGNGLLSGLEQGARNLERISGKAENIAKMSEYFDSMKEPLSEMGGLLKDLAGVFLNVGSQNNLASVIQGIRSEIVPVLAEFNRSTSELFTKNLIEALGAIGRVFADLSSATGGLTIVVKVVGQLADALDRLLDLIPPLKELIGVFATLKVVSAISGFTGIGGQAGAGIGAALGATGKQAIYEMQFAGAVAKETAASTSTLTRATQANAVVSATAAQGWAGFKNVLSSAGGQMIAVTGAIVGVAAAYEYLQKSQKKIQDGFKETVNSAVTNRLSTGNLDTSEARRQIEDLRSQADDRPGLLFIAYRQNLEAAAKELQDTYIPALEKQQQVINEVSATTGVAIPVVAAWAAEQAKAGVVFKDSEDAIAAYNQSVQNNTDKIINNALASLTSVTSTNAAEDAVRKYNETLSNNGLTLEQVAQNEKSAEQAARAVTSAYRGLQQATRSLEAAQKALREALKPASYVEMARGTLSFTSAQIEARRAAEDLQKLLTGQGEAAAKTAKQIRTVTQVTDEFTGRTYQVVRMEAGDAEQGQSAQDKARAIEDAQMRVESANLAVIESEQTLLTLRQKGTELDPAVVAARQAVEDAEYGVQQAHIAVTDALKAQNEMYLAQQEMMKQNANIANETAATIIQASRDTSAAIQAATGDSTRALIAQVGELIRIRETIPAGSPVRSVVDGLIAELQKGIDPKVNSYLNVQDAYRAQAAQVTGVRASGGPVALGNLYRVNDGPDRAMEFFRPNVNGEIVTQQQLVSSTSTATKTNNIENHFHERVDPDLLARAQAWEMN